MRASDFLWRLRHNTATMYIDSAKLEKWMQLARRDDCFTASDGFVPSDIREMLGEITRLRQGVAALARHIPQLPS